MTYHKDAIERSAVLTNECNGDSNLPSRIKKLLLRNRILEPDVKGKIMVIYNDRDTFWGLLSKKQGLFSEFFSVLGALYYAEQHEASGVYVNFQSDIYLDPQRGDNWWAYFFEPKMMVRGDNGNPQKIHFNRHISRFGPFTWNLSWDRVIIPKYSPSCPYPMNASDEMKKVSDLVGRHITVKSYILEKVEVFRSAYMDDAFVIGIHYRGTDKKLLYPYESPPYSLFDEYVGRVLRRYNQDLYKIFVATDETEFIEWMEAHHPGKVVYWETSPRLSSRDTLATRGGTHKSKTFSNFLKGESAVIDCLLLSRCNYIIKNRSSLSDAALAFNPSICWTMILGVNDTIYSNDLTI